MVGIAFGSPTVEPPPDAVGVIVFAAVRVTGPKGVAEFQLPPVLMLTENTVVVPGTVPMAALPHTRAEPVHPVVVTVVVPSLVQVLPLMEPW